MLRAGGDLHTLARIQTEPGLEVDFLLQSTGPGSAEVGQAQGYVSVPNRGHTPVKQRPGGGNSHYTNITGVTMAPRTALPRISVTEIRHRCNFVLFLTVCQQVNVLEAMRI